MTSWLAKAKSHFLQNSEAHTPKTPKTLLLGVTGACSALVYEKQQEVSGVLGGCSGRICANDEISDPLLIALMAAAMNACDFWGDSPKAREQMRLEILETRPEHREELLRMFKADYPAPGAQNDSVGEG
ncbi:hypothetical protein [Comamonas odontotermitis]|uniref:hypothetical protein n=1 Tax=Comamonas odontotermitis TaxID=379895 RepID=UPI003750A70D